VELSPSERFTIANQVLVTQGFFPPERQFPALSGGSDWSALSATCIRDKANPATIEQGYVS
jgi:hypothetical protein